MNPVQGSVVTAIALSAAAGKNPWIPLGLLFLFAAPDSVPEILMEPELHAALHQIGSPALLWSLAGTFLVLAALESLADKISFVERWLVPISTMWRPFAGVAVAAIVGLAVADYEPMQETLARMTDPLAVRTAETEWLLGGSIVALTILAGAVFAGLATLGKTGTRLLLSLVPVPGLRLLHSFVDDVFALAAAFAGFAFGQSTVMLVLVALYLIVGLFTGPLLSRLAWIHFRVGLALANKVWRKTSEVPAERVVAPSWLSAALGKAGIDPARTVILPAYTYRAPELGRARVGFLVLAEGAVFFAARVAFRARLLEMDHDALARIGLSQTATSRSVAITFRTAEGVLRETLFYLFPSAEDEVLPALEHGSLATGLARVRPDSESARAALPGFADRGRSVRFLDASAAGSLRGQAVVTLVAAFGVGVFTGGLFVPIGAGYLFSPFKRRFVLSLFASAWLSLSVLGTAGFAWPVALLYATLLNVLALRDLARAAIKARVDGFVDRRAFLPPVCDRVWVPEKKLAHDRDLFREGDALPLTDGPWRAVVAVLAEGERERGGAPATVA
jgi:hypothetical protein